jgi:hypothetical protein
MVVRKIQNRELGKLLRVLFHSGGSHTVTNRSVLPVGTTTTHPVNNGEQNCQTIAGNFRSTETVNLMDCMLPEFDPTKRIYGCKAFVFEQECNYDVILGRDILRDIGLKMDFETNVVEWMNGQIGMKQRGHWN